MTKYFIKGIKRGINFIKVRISLSKQNKELKKFKNIHRGEDCIILGAGPSLNELPQNFLEKCVVIGTNLSFKYYKPDYWIVIDAQYSWLEEGRKLCTENNIPSFINWLWAREKPDIIYPNEISLHAHKISLDQSPNNKMLIKHLTNAYNRPRYIERKGFTSVNSVVSEGALPLANYMGFERIFLAGVDYYTPKEGSLHFTDDTEEDIALIDNLRKWVEKKDNTGKDLFDIKRWPIELVGQSNLKSKVFNLSKKSTVKNIPKINYKDIVF